MPTKGINFALKENVFRYTTQKTAGLLDSVDIIKPTIFVSHKKEDSYAANIVADYIMNAGLNVYFDLYDEKLANIDNLKPNIITNAITSALNSADYMICIISEKTKDSWWVPYEIGYAWERDTINRKDIKLLYLKDIKYPPDYFHLLENIETFNELDKFLNSIASFKLLNESFVKKASVHPLSKIMN